MGLALWGLASSCGPADGPDATVPEDALEAGADAISPDAHDASNDGAATTDTTTDSGADVVLPGQVVATAPVDPDTGAQVALPDDQLVVTVPAGALTEAGELVISGGPLNAPSLPWTFIDSWDLKLVVNGQPVQPRVPLIVRFRVPDGVLGAEEPPEDWLSIATLPDDASYWEELPVEITNDGTGVWVQAQLDHLSGVADYRFSEGESVLGLPNWRFVFDPMVDAVGLGGTNIEGVVVGYHAVLEEAYAKYAAIHPSPRDPPTNWKRLTVYVLPFDDEGASFDPNKLQVLLNAKIATDGEARYEAYHELYHWFQRAQLSAATMSKVRWFVEAGATYMGAVQSQQPTILEEKVKLDFFSRPWDENDDKHAYGLAYFFLWLGTNPGYLTLEYEVMSAVKFGNDAAAALEQAVAMYAIPANPTMGWVDAHDVYLHYAQRAMSNLVGNPPHKASDWVGVSEVLTATEQEATVDLEVEPRTVGFTWLTAALKAGESSRPVIVSVTPDAGSDCRLKLLNYFDDSPSQGSESSNVTTDPVTGALRLEWDVVPPRMLAVHATTGSSCRANVRFRDKPFCTLSDWNPSYAMTSALHCEDASGMHDSMPSSCQGSSGTIRHMGCELDSNGELACVDLESPIECTTPPLTVCYLDTTTWARPYCDAP